MERKRGPRNMAQIKVWVWETLAVGGGVRGQGQAGGSGQSQDWAPALSTLNPTLFPRI